MEMTEKIKFLLTFSEKNRKCNHGGFMPVSYEPLFHTLIRKGLKKTDLKRLAGLSANAVAKFAKGEPVSLEIIEKLCAALDCEPGDIFEIMKDEK